MGHTYIHADYHDVTHIIINPEEVKVVITEQAYNFEINAKPVVFQQPSKTLKFEVAAQQNMNVEIGGGASITYLNRTIYYEVDEMPLSKKIDWVGDNAFYKGEADPGTGSPELKWRIKYVEFLNDEGDLDELWANGTGSPVHSWTLRASYPYS
jgi:hypothetical protein